MTTTDAQAVRVKPLDWHTKVQGFSCSIGVISYSIMESRNRVYGITGDHDGAAEFPTLAEAKAAAQADYEARILSALEPDALTAAERRGYLRGLEDAAKVVRQFASMPCGYEDDTPLSRQASLTQDAAAAIRALATKGEPT